MATDVAYDRGGMQPGFVGILLALSGCDRAFGLATIPPDAARLGYIAPGDLDGDGVPNELDPCPLDADQSHAVNDDGDGDGLGDGCDPNLNAGLPDCIVLLDDFVGHDLAWTLATKGLAVCTDGHPGLCVSDTATQLASFSGLPAIAELDAEIYLSLVQNLPTDALQLTTTLFTELDHTSSARACGVGRLGTLPVVAISDLDHDRVAQLTHADAPELQFEAAQEVALSWMPMTGACAEENAGIRHAVSDTSALPPSGMAVGLRTVGVTGTITRVVAYGARCAR